MKPHPRIRKTVKWGGTTLSLLLIASWLASGWWTVSWRSPDGWFVGGGGGAFFATWVDRPATPSSRPASSRLPSRGGELLVRRNNRFALLGAPAFTFRARATLGGAPAAAAPPFHYARVRIWVLAAIVLAPTVLIWVIDIRAARRDRRARLNHCPKCNYDRTGLAAGAVCPECGQARPTS